MSATVFAWLAILALSADLALQAADPPARASAVPTFHSMSLYWHVPGHGAGDQNCRVRYRQAGEE
ncbi:MAG: hypothetical protein O2795_05320 [Acidobacteria bacterium]|nr:hypothetical protein [Acidobacteriota bacterium]